ncbi:Up-frameshift suppressor 2 [Gracilaria domingensis]|nr:Up-frameshift suppressor 2 [Gracilaria domingensis]
MNSPQRDEGGRGRRRRRRGPPPNNRNDADQSSQSQRQTRKSQSYQPKPYRNARRENAATQSQNQSGNEKGKRSQSNNAPLPPGANRDKHDATAKAGKVPVPVAESGPQTSPDKAMEQKAIEEEKERKNREKEREEAERRALLEAQNAKRSAERDRNLLYNESVQGDSMKKERPSDSELRQLDSSLKKCTGFLRKIRFSGITADSASTLCNEAQTLNLSRYISEVVAAITESKLRSSDIENVIKLCGEMHRRYEDFTSQLIASLANVIVGSTGNGAARELASRKASMRLMVEMFVVGMISDINPVTSVLKQLMKASKESMENAVQSLAILATFVRCANRTLLPLPLTLPKVPTDPNAADSLDFTAWETNLLPESAKSNILGALESFYISDVERIVKDAANTLNKAKLALNRSVQMRGSPDESRSNAFETAKHVSEKITTSANVLAESLGKPAIDVPGSEGQGMGSPVEASVGQDSSHVIVANPFNSFGRSRQSAQDVDMMMHADHPFEGDQQRIFYTELVSAKDILAKAREPLQRESSQTEKNVEVQSSEHVGVQKSFLSSNKGDSPDVKVNSNGRSTNDGRRKGSEKHLSIDRLFSRLSTTETKEDADNFVRQFIHSTDGVRNLTKRLGKALLSVSAQKLNVLPAYSRIAATLQAIYPDMISTIATGLEEEFRFLVSKPDADEKILSTCTKSATYVGEYVKFGLISSSVMFELLALCMRDLTGHRVDLACHLLETCGRYVYLSPTTHIRMANILETLWRLKSVKNLEARHNTLIETAFFAVRLSPGSKAHKKKSRPPLHEYIRHLIYSRLDSTNIGWTQSQLMKLPWNDELESYVARKFVKISRARFSTIPFVAALIGSLQKDKPGMVISVIDSLLESIRAGMEKNDGRESQRRLAEVHLLGELHSCGIVDEKVIYNVLYLFITLGHENGDVNQRKGRTGSNEIHVAPAQISNENSMTKNGTFTNAPDPPGDFFRIRLACSLLESCGRVLAVANRRKLEVFWLFMERYMFCKTYQAGQGDSLPLHINHVVGDLFESLMHKPKRIGKEVRVHQTSANDRKGYHSSNKMVEKGYGRMLKRSKNLEEATRAVMFLERSPADLALVAIPSRRIEGKQERRPEMNGSSRGSRSLSTSLSSPAPGSGIRGNVRDGFVTTNSRKRESEAEHTQNGSIGDDFNGAESVSDDMLSQEMNAEEGYYDEEYEGDETPESEEYAESLEDDSGEDEGNDSEESDDEDISFRRQRPRTEEEDAFAKELAAFTAAAVQSARTSTSRITKFDRMAIPMALMTQKMEEEKAAAAAAAAEAANSGNQEFTSDDDDEGTTKSKHGRSQQKKSVEFKMLVRKGGKSQLHGLKVPASSSLAVAAKESETADAARSAETKRLVLGSTTVLNDDSDDLDDEVPLRFQQDVRDKEKSIRQQRVDDERELLSTLFRTRPRR